MVRLTVKQVLRGRRAALDACIAGPGNDDEHTRVTLWAAVDGGRGDGDILTSAFHANVRPRFDAMLALFHN
jgi:hypothetical protein